MRPVVSDMVLIDSSAWIEALRKRGAIEVKLAIESLLEAYAATWCSAVRLEVLGGARAEERHRLGVYFSVIPYLSTNEEDWNRAIALAWKLRDNGITVPWLDVLIASIAIGADLRLYAVDAHFIKIAKLSELRLYEPGCGGAFTLG